MARPSGHPDAVAARALRAQKIAALFSSELRRNGLAWVSMGHRITGEVKKHIDRIVHDIYTSDIKPTYAELARAIGKKSHHTVVRMVLSHQTRGATTMGPFVPQPKDEDLENKEREACYKYVMRLPMTTTEIALVWGKPWTREKVKQIENAAMAKIQAAYKELHDEGVRDSREDE